MSKNRNSKFLKGVQLDLRNVKLDRIPEIISEIPYVSKVRVVILDGQKLTQYPFFLNYFSNFSQLTSLQLNNCSIQKLEMPIELLKRLKYLGMSKNFVDEFIFPENLNFVPALKTLSLTINDLTSLPLGITKFANLSDIYLRKNNLNESSFSGDNISKFFNTLPSLVTLDLSFNLFNSFSSGLFNFKRIQSFSMSDNHLTSVRLNFDYPTSLKKIDLSNNLIEEFEIGSNNFEKLRCLYLTNNKLLDFPQGLVNLRKLSLLNIKNNPIKSIPIDICERLVEKRENGEPLLRLNLQNCPITTPPQELFQNLDRLKRYLDSVSKNYVSDIINETKMIVVGEGDVGKTSLIETICNRDYKLGGAIRTKGIDVSSWNYTFNGEKVNINIWDFGGQEIYHSTHQFFLTTRTIYLYVVNVRRDINSDTDYYWLNLIKLMGRDSPVIVVVNKIDLLTMKRGIYEFQKFNKNVIGVVHTSCETKEGIQDLKDLIINQIENMDLRIRLKESWLKLRNALNDLHHNTGKDKITKNEFKQICSELTIEDESEELLEIFNLLGFLSYYSGDIYLENLIILNPLWITKAIYSILDDEVVAQNNGIIKAEDINRIWKDCSFTDNISQLVALMRKFNICHEIESGRKFLIPQLVGDRRIESVLTSDFDLIVCYEYKFMPKGIISNLFTHLFGYIESDNYSRDRVLFSQNGISILLEERYFDRRINCFIKGANYHQLFFLIRENIMQLHGQFPNIEFTEKISCQCFECKRSQDSDKVNYFSVEYLRKKESEGANSVECQVSTESVQILELLGQLENMAPNRHAKSVFVELVVEKVLNKIFHDCEVQRGFKLENNWEYDFIITDKKYKELVVIEVKALKDKNPMTVGFHYNEKGTLKWFFEKKLPYFDEMTLKNKNPLLNGLKCKASYFSLSGFTSDCNSYFVTQPDFIPTRISLFYNREKLELLLNENNMKQEIKELKRFI